MGYRDRRIAQKLTGWLAQSMQYDIRNTRP